MSRFNSLCLASTTVSLLLATTLASGATFYKWVDENGSTHYSQTPPKGSKIHSRKVEVNATQPSAAAPTTPATDNGQTQPAETNQTSQTPAQNTSPIMVPQVINNGPKAGSLIITQPPQQGLSPNSNATRPTFANPQQSSNANGGLDKAL